MKSCRIRKIAIGEREVLKKRYAQNNSGVSFWCDELTSDECTIVLPKRSGKTKRGFGVSKKEYNASARSFVDGLRSAVNGVA